MNESHLSASDAWQYLFEHRRLQWLPPIWRDREGDWEAPGLEQRLVRAVERNLVVHRTTGVDPCFVLLTGPLNDLRRDGVVDPVTPAMEIDERLCGQGRTFEQALKALAAAVRSTYDGVGDRDTLGGAAARACI